MVPRWAGLIVTRPGPDPNSSPVLLPALNPNQQRDIVTPSSSLTAPVVGQALALLEYADSVDEVSPPPPPRVP